MYRKAQHLSREAENTNNILLILIIVYYPKVAHWYTEESMASRKCQGSRGTLTLGQWIQKGDVDRRLQKEEGMDSEQKSYLMQILV